MYVRRQHRVVDTAVFCLSTVYYSTVNLFLMGQSVSISVQKFRITLTQYGRDDKTPNEIREWSETQEGL